MRFDDIMHDLGADDHPLDAEERAALDRDGYVLLPDVVDSGRVAAINAFCDRHLRERGAVVDGSAELEYRIYDCPELDPVFDVGWSHPRILAAARHVLHDEFRPMSLNYRSPPPGCGNQCLHSDKTRDARSRVNYCQAILMLCDFTERNGPTRLVPGSWLLKHYPEDEMADTSQPHPRQALMTGRAGSVLVFNGLVWHSGTTNRADRPRPCLHCGFALRHSDQAEIERQRGTISEATYRRLTPTMRNFLDFKVVADGERQLLDPRGLAAAKAS